MSPGWFRNKNQQSRNIIIFEMPPGDLKSLLSPTPQISPVIRYAERQIVFYGYETFARIAINRFLYLLASTGFQENNLRRLFPQ